MYEKRIIPTLLLNDGSLVKTTRFKKPVHVGDPCNTVRIFNEIGVDEILLLDIGKRKQNKMGPDFTLLKDIAAEAFIPMAYGGGIQDLNDASTIFRIGFEKIVLNTLALNNPQIIQEFSAEFGSQAVMVSIDYKTSFFGHKKIFNPYANDIKCTLREYADCLVEAGAGELLITNVDREGTWLGLDIAEELADIPVPVIYSGGVKGAQDAEMNLLRTDVDAIGVGNTVVFQKRNCGVLINFPFKSYIHA